MTLLKRLDHPDEGLDAVLARMRALGSGLPPRDGLGVFNHVYLTVTEEIARQVRAGTFGARDPVVTLDVLFAGRYLRAALAPEARTAPACWRPLLRARHHPGVLPVQFALAGINAHIGHDLALAVVDTCVARGCRPDDVEDAFDRVGDLLARLEERIREDLMPGPDLLQLADPLTHVVGCWSLEHARGGAWAAARALWALRGVPPLAGEMARRLDTSVGLVGRLLLTPLPGASRLAPLTGVLPAQDG